MTYASLMPYAFLFLLFLSFTPIPPPPSLLSPPLLNKVCHTG